MPGGSFQASAQTGGTYTKFSGGSFQEVRDEDWKFREVKKTGIFSWSTREEKIAYRKSSRDL